MISNPYQLEFNEQALKEWRKLPPPIRDIFKEKLRERLQYPDVPSARLSGGKLTNCYKIKLRDSGYRLVYQLQGKKFIILVLAIGKRDKSTVYDIAQKRRPADKKTSQKK